MGDERHGYYSERQRGLSHGFVTIWETEAGDHVECTQVGSISPANFDDVVDRGVVVKCIKALTNDEMRTMGHYI